MLSSLIYFNTRIATNIGSLAHGMIFSVRVKIINWIFNMMITQFLNVILILLLLALELFEAVDNKLFILLFLLFILLVF